MILNVLLIIVVVTVLVFFNALYVAGEFSSVGARRTRIVQMAEEGSRLARMLIPVMNDPHHLDNYIAASQVGITLSSIVLGIYGQRQIAPLIEPLFELLPLGRASSAGAGVAAAGASATIVLIVLTILQVVFGELVPKSIAVQYPERLALLTAIPMKWSADIILKPLIVLLNGSGRLVLKVLGVEYGGEHAHVHSPEEIIILVKESHRGGLIDADERRLLRNVFRVSETTAVEVAVPRPRIVAAPVEKPVSEILRLAADSSYTRIPIYEKDIDHILGFVHLRDLYSLYQQDPAHDVWPIIRQMPFVPETLPSIEVWNRLNEADSYLAVVFDEYGGTSGLITREDLIEELFGELQDEFDHERELVTPMGEGRLVVRGDMLVTYLEEMLNVDLPHETSHTVGGLVLDALGRIPTVGDQVDVAGLTLRVEAIAGNSVSSVCVILPPGVHAEPVEEEGES